MSQLTLYEPRAIAPIFEEVLEPGPISRLMDEAFSPFSLSRLEEEFFPRALSEIYPTVEVKEEKDHFMVTAEVPGMTKDDLKVEVKSGVLTISGEKKHEKKEKKEGYFYSERSYGSFSRSFRLSENISDKGMETSFKNGVLHVSLKKAKGKDPKRRECKA